MIFANHLLSLNDLITAASVDASGKSAPGTAMAPRDLLLRRSSVRCGIAGAVHRTHLLQNQLGIRRELVLPAGETHGELGDQHANGEPVTPLAYQVVTIS